LVESGRQQYEVLYRLANSHRSNNLVESLVVDGNMTDDFVVIKDHIVNFYRQLYFE